MFSSSEKSERLEGKPPATSGAMEAAVAKEREARVARGACPLDAERGDTVSAVERGCTGNFRHRALGPDARNGPDLGKRVAFV